MSSIPDVPIPSGSVRPMTGSATPLSTRDNLFVDLDAVRRLSRQVRLEQSFGVHDLDGWESRLVDLVRDRRDRSL